MSNTLTITLKQHTPIIHFQHAQPGATLRATELKPKIDAFVKTHFDDLFRQFEPELYEKTKHLVCDEYFSLAGEPVIAPYKLSIAPKGEQKSLIPKSIFTKGDSEISEEKRLEGAFFGDIDQFRANYSTGGVEIQVFSFIPYMKELIQAVIPFVVAIHNFGCRQSKGFGCFSATQKDDQKREKYSEDWHKRLWLSYRKYDAVFIKDGTINGYQNQIKAIKNDYQLLKSGKNGPRNNDYQKSSLFLYMVEQPREIRWEKRKIKQFITGNTQNFGNKELLARYDAYSTPTGEPDDDFSLDDPDPAYNYRFVRALLGLAEQHEYLIYGYDDEKGNPKQDSKLRYKIGFEHQPEEGLFQIERFGSPILFKIYGQRVYALVSPIEQSMFNQAFKLTLSLKGDESKSAITMPDSLWTPSSDEFDLVEFLDEYLNGYTKIEQ